LTRARSKTAQGSCGKLYPVAAEQRREFKRESAPKPVRSPISIIWHDSWQQEQPIRRTNRYIHTEWCVGWLFLFHHPCLFGLSPVWVHRPAQSETRYQYRTVHRSVGPLAACHPVPGGAGGSMLRVRGARWARVSATEQGTYLLITRPACLHLQSVTTFELILPAWGRGRGDVPTFPLPMFT
jgi:hypothetical protein